MRPSPSRTISWIASGTVAVAAVTAIGVGVASAGSPSTKHNVLRFDAAQASEVQLQLGKGESLIGNEFIDHWTLTRNGAASGSLDTTCQLVSSNDTSSTAQCVATAALAKGQITIQGLVALGQNGPGDFDLAITGGTGAYRSARGVVHVHPVSQTAEQVDIEVTG